MILSVETQYEKVMVRLRFFQRLASISIIILNLDLIIKTWIIKSYTMEISYIACIWIQQNFNNGSETITTN